MAFTEKSTVSKIKTHIEKRGGVFKSWFVGIGKHARTELQRHGVKRKGDRWIFVHASSAKVADSARSHLVKAHGLLTQEVPEDRRGDFVYAYRRGTNTKP